MLGICNGFQVLAEAGLVPGALLRNASLRFEHRWVRLSVERRDTPFTRPSRRARSLRMPIAHGEGNYFLPDADLDALEARGGVARSATRRRRATPTARARHRGRASTPPATSAG